MADPYNTDPMNFIRFAQQAQPAPAAAPQGVPAASMGLTPGTPAAGGGSMGPAHAALQQKLMGGLQGSGAQGGDIQSLLQSLIANPQQAQSQYGMTPGTYTPTMPDYYRVNYQNNAGQGGLLSNAGWGNALFDPHSLLASVINGQNQGGSGQSGGGSDPYSGMGRL